LSDITPDEHVLLLTGIASPRQLIEDLSPYVTHLTPLTFPDHHQFRHKDIRRLNETFKAMPSPKCIVTTEKDAQRLAKREDLPEILKERLFYIPIISEIIPEAVSVRCIEEELGEIGMAQLKESIVKYININ
jgi:tetraacyldisaccharide 4'-kinase